MQEKRDEKSEKNEKNEKSEKMPFPIQFSVPEEKMVDRVPAKDKDFATVVPGRLDTYVFVREQDYYEDYRRSYFAFTWKKGGWDCMRHWEILACGCVPYFSDLDRCPDDRTMMRLPRALIREAMALPGVSSNGTIDHRVFDKARYHELAQKLLDYTRRELGTRSMARYILTTLGFLQRTTTTTAGMAAAAEPPKKVLFLSENPLPDYLRCLTLIGLVQVLGERQVVAYPRIPHIYKSFPAEQAQRLYGRGMTYSRVLEEEDEKDENRNGEKKSFLEDRIRAKEFDLVLYGSVHRGMPFLELVREVYPRDKIAYICGEDDHRCEHVGVLHNFFLREYHGVEKLILEAESAAQSMTRQ
jgi:hypothetical protein